MIFEEKILESERIYDGKILNLRRDKVTTKNGTSYREIVEHNGGAAVAAITADKKILMVRQYRIALQKPILEVPAGKIEIGEDPFSTVSRELEEETGYKAGKIEELTSMYPSVGYTSEKVYLYLATDLVPGKQHLDPNEALDVLEYDFDEAYEMVQNGEIEDGKSIIAILMAKQRLGL